MMSKHKKRFLIFFIFILIFAPMYSVVAGKGFSAQPVFNPPTQGLPTNLGQLIQQIFMWSLSILGISVFIMFFYSGFLWLTAAGNTSKIGEAKTHMTNAVFGAILLLSSYLILYTINPDFVKNTVNLPGLGTTTSTNPPPGGGLTCTDVPTAQSCSAPNQVAVVQQVKNSLIAQNVDISGFCGALEITKRVACAVGAGLLTTNHSGQCSGIAAGIIAYPDDSEVDILGDEGGANTPDWQPGPDNPEPAVHYTPASCQ